MKSLVRLDAKFFPSEADQRWNAETSPANKEGFDVPGRSSPVDVELRTVSAMQHWNENLHPDSEEEFNSR